MNKIIPLYIIITLIAADCLNAQKLNVEEMEIGTNIEDRQIIGADSSFTSSVETLFCFTKIAGAEDNTQISHVWLHEGEEKARIPLSIQARTWRTWSSKTIPASWTGSWKVVIEDKSGDILAEKDFNISEEE